MTNETISLLEAGIEANTKDRWRKFNVVNLGSDGDVVIAGDIHGHRRNFERVVSYADLAENPKRHLVLQEIIHGGDEDSYGGCLSYEVLLDAVKLKIVYPDRVHMILANHDTAFINNSEVMKNGKEMNIAMRDAMKRQYGKNFGAVESAVERFLFSQPMGLRCENRIWISHSLPADRYAEKFDFSIFNRQLKISDIVRPNSAYTFTWGRRQSAATLKMFAEKLDVDFLVLGHQVQESGWCSNDNNLVIIDSQHNHGFLIHIDLSKSYSIDSLVRSLIPLAQIA
ncbi:MAG: metallophosphoesterase [Anaerohalosphaeraceae bacterium]|nr:metallophosphoesterase [Anaerohalosphaeraceae bacterium]